MSTSFRLVRTLMLFAVTGVLASPAVAQVVLISNLPGDDGGQSGNLNDTRNKGMGFSLPAGQDYALQFATLRLESFGAIQPVVELWSDGGGVPGAMIEVLSNPTFGASGIADYDFTSSGTTLTGGQSYWLVAYGVGGAAQYNWKASTVSQTPTGIATHLGSTFDTDGPPPTNTSGILTSYSITAMLVPVELQSFSIE